MPATRSSKGGSKGKQKISPQVISEDDVIVISSEDEAPDSMTIQLRRAREENRLLRKQMLRKEASRSQVLSEQGNQQASDHSDWQNIDGERLGLEALLQQATAEINKLQSSLRLEKDVHVRESAKITVMKMHANAAEVENANLKRLNEELLNRIDGMSSNKGLQELEDHILCEICQDRLWHPYTLVECGHTLCQGCLTDWFNAAIAADVHQPRYECPKCRSRVYQKPVENFTLKGIVRALAYAIDAANVSPPPPPRQGTGRGPWFRFFGQ